MNIFFSASQKRIIKVLELLNENDEGLSVNLGIKQIGCKKDTLLKDIKTVDILYVKNNFIYLNSKILKISYYKALSIKDSLEFKMIKEIYEGTFVSLEDFSIANYISRSTAQRKLINLKKVARSYNVSIQLNQKNKVSGLEFDIRVFYSEMFSYVYNYFEWSVEKKKIAMIRNYIQRIFSLLGQKQNNEVQNKVSYYYLVSFHRIKQANEMNESIMNLFEEIQQFISSGKNSIINKVKKKIDKLIEENGMLFTIDELESTVLLIVVLLFKNYNHSTSITTDLYQILVTMETKKVNVTEKLVSEIMKEFNVTLKKNELKSFYLTIFFFVSHKKIWNRWKSVYLENNKLLEFQRYDVHMYRKIQSLNSTITANTQLKGYEFSSYTETLKLNALILGTHNHKYLNRNKEAVIFYTSQMGLNHETMIQSQIEKLIIPTVTWASKLTERVDIIVTDKLAFEFLEFREKIILVNILPTEKDIYKLKNELSRLNMEGN